jgi:hypothetical protein
VQPPATGKVWVTKLYPSKDFLPGQGHIIIFTWLDEVNQSLAFSDSKIDQKPA